MAFSAASLSRCERHAVFGKIDALVLAELIHNPVHHALVNVVAAQMRVAVGGLHLHHAFADFQDRYIERSAAEVVDRDGFVLFLVQTIRQRRRRRLVHDAQNLQAGDFSRILGGLALAVIEVRRHRDHRLGDLFAQVLFRSVLHLLQNHRRDLRRRVLLTLGYHPHVAVLAARPLCRAPS